MIPEELVDNFSLLTHHHHLDEPVEHDDKF